MVAHKFSLSWKAEGIYLTYWLGARNKKQEESTRSKKILKKESTNSCCTIWEYPLNSCIVTLTLFVPMKLLSGILRYPSLPWGLFKCHQGNNKATHMKRALCGILYEKHWIKLLHNNSSAYERRWTVREPSRKQCWTWFLPPLTPLEILLWPKSSIGLWEILAVLMTSRELWAKLRRLLRCLEKKNPICLLTPMTLTLLYQHFKKLKFPILVEIIAPHHGDPSKTDNS